MRGRWVMRKDGKLPLMNGKPVLWSKHKHPWELLSPWEKKCCKHWWVRRNTFSCYALLEMTGCEKEEMEKTLGDLCRINGVFANEAAAQEWANENLNIEEVYYKKLVGFWSGSECKGEPTYTSQKCSASAELDTECYAQEGGYEKELSIIGGPMTWCVCNDSSVEDCLSPEEDI